MNLQVGNIVRFYGARFESIIIEIVEHRSMHEIFNEQRDTVMHAKDKWLDGAIINGYFGPESLGHSKEIVTSSTA